MNECIKWNLTAICGKPDKSGTYHITLKDQITGKLRTRVIYYDSKTDKIHHFSREKETKPPSEIIGWAECDKPEPCWPAVIITKTRMGIVFDSFLTMTKSEAIDAVMAEKEGRCSMPDICPVLTKNSYEKMLKDGQTEDFGIISRCALRRKSDEGYVFRSTGKKEITLASEELYGIRLNKMEIKKILGIDTW